MAINPVSNSLYYSYLTNQNTNKSETEETADSMLARYSNSKNNAYSAYGSNMYNGVGQSAMQRAIEELQKQNGGKVTFSMVSDYRAELEEDFKNTMLAGLALLGFEETDEFHMVANSEGEIQVISDDPEVKAAVEFLLEETPELGEQFLYIQALGNIERAKGTVSAQSQMGYTKAGLASEAVDIILNGANLLNQLGSLGVGYSALMANYSQNDIQYMMGANYLV